MNNTMDLDAKDAERQTEDALAQPVDALAQDLSYQAVFPALHTGAFDFVWTTSPVINPEETFSPDVPQTKWRAVQALQVPRAAGVK